MKSTKLCFLSLLVAILFISIPVKNVKAANVWVSMYPTPLRTVYVNPSGGGSGTSTSSPIDLNSAISGAKAGDLIYLMAGSYSGNFDVLNSGTSSNPIVFRNYQNGEAKITGSFTIDGAYVWVWGLEIVGYMPDINSGIGLHAASAIDLYNKGDRAINNYVHDSDNLIGIGAWNDGPGQIIYGNISYKNQMRDQINILKGRLLNPHNMYTQNSYYINGYKYVVGNQYIMDPTQEAACPQCLDFQAYGESNGTSGYWMTHNIFSLGNVVVGANTFEPPVHEYLDQNLFYNNQWVFLGYFSSPSQVTFTNNYMGNDTLDMENMRGVGDTLDANPLPNTLTGNTFLKKAGNGEPNVKVSTTNGGPRLLSTDVFDHNTYYNFNGIFAAGGVTTGSSTSFANFASWQTATSQAGNAFDKSSTNSTSLPSAPQVFTFQNEYDPTRINVAIYNWGGQASASVDLTGLITSGTTYKVQDATNLFGSPVTSGTYNGPISVPISGKEFSSYVVIASSATVSTPTPSPTITPVPTPSCTIPSVAGDTNNDGKTDGIDYVATLIHQGQTSNLGPSFGDINCDGVVNSTDLNIVISNIH